MISRILGNLAGLLVAFGILFVSIVKASSLQYQFNLPSPEPQEKNSQNTNSKDIKIDYWLPDPGEIMPANPLWLALAAVDKIRAEGVSDPFEKSLVLLEISDKRFSVGCKLFKEGEFEESVLTFRKAEKYLEESFKEENVARSGGVDTRELLKKIHFASSYHRADLESHLSSAPEDARPFIISILDLPKRVFEDTKNVLSDFGVVTADPFQV